MSIKSVLEKYVDNEQLMKLLSQMADVFTEEEYTEEVYNIIGDLINDVNVDVIIENLKQNKYGWNAVYFDEFKKRQEEIDKYTDKPFDISSDGVCKCKFCGSYKTVSRLEQRRAGDEQATNIVLCTKCGKKSIY